MSVSADTTLDLSDKTIGLDLWFERRTAHHVSPHRRAERHDDA